MTDACELPLKAALKLKENLNFQWDRWCRAQYRRPAAARLRITAPQQQNRYSISMLTSHKQFY